MFLSGSTAEYSKNKKLILAWPSIKYNSLINYKISHTPNDDKEFRSARVNLAKENVGFRKDSDWPS